MASRRSTSAGLLLFLICLVACRKPKAKEVTIDDDLAAVAPVEATFGELPKTLPTRIVVTTTELRFSGDRYRIARVPFGKDDIQDGVLLPLRLAVQGDEAPPTDAGSQSGSKTSREIQAELSSMFEGHQVLLVADRSTPFSVLAPIVATAASGYPARVGLVTRGTSHAPSVLELRQELRGLPSEGKKESTPRVAVDARGVTVSLDGRALAPGCTDDGEGVTIPKTGGEHDVKALEACARALHTAIDRAAEDQLWMSASPDTDLATLVHVIAAFRTSFSAVGLARSP